jgi:hypothetical protein
MKQRVCDDKSLLMAYLYGECDEAERQAVEAHLADCAACATELDALRGVRVVLGEWAPPDQALGFRVVGEADAPARAASPVPPRDRRTAHWFRPRVPARVPAWAQAAAAVLVLAAGAGIANLNVHIGRDGVTLRTGWQQPAGAPSQAQQAPAQVNAAPWRADLAALERRLRQDLPAATAVTAAAAGASTDRARAPSDSTATITRVQTLLDDRDRRLQREFDQQLAERFLRFTRDVESQRAADQRRVLQGLSQIDLRTNQLSQVQNYMLRTASVQEIK